MAINSSPSQSHPSQHSGYSDMEPQRIRRVSEQSQGPGLLEMVAGDEPEDPEQMRLGARSSSVINFYPDWCKCFDCLEGRSDNRRSDGSFTVRDQLMNFCECPPSGTLGRLLVFTFICILGWGLMFYLLRPFSEDLSPGSSHEPDNNHNPAWVKGPLFALLIIETTGLVSGILLKRYLNFPSLLGPLVLGIIYNNASLINVFDFMKPFMYRDCSTSSDIVICEKLASHGIGYFVKPIRLIALAFILTRAGIELSPKQLKKLKGIVPLLAFGPCIVEAFTCAGANYFFFNILKTDHKMSLAMCFVGGFALAAVSPAVVVPGVLSLKRSGYGVEKGIPTLLIAASSIDDVLAISAYTIALGFAIKSTESTADWQGYSGGVIGIIVGIIHGIFFGIILHFIPPRKSKGKPLYRIILLLMVNIVSVMAYDETWYSSAGSISILVTSFIAGFGWRSQPHWKRPMHKIERWLAHIWVLWIPLIFGTIGKEINFADESFTPGNLASTFAVIFIALTARCLFAFTIVSFGLGFTRREKLFIALSWIPKATVQAALAPLVLTRAADSDGESIATAKLVVNVAILAVLITAPVGSILIALTGPVLLQKFQTPDDIIEEEFPNGEGIDPAESTFPMVERNSTAGRYASRADGRLGSSDTSMNRVTAAQAAAAANSETYRNENR